MAKRIEKTKVTPLEHDPNWQQAQASDPQANVFVAASAGTGKTKILADRYLRLLLAGNQPNRILCITYTKAAANEMLVRIKKRLREWFLADEKKLDCLLKNLLLRNPATNELTLAKKLYFILIEQEPQLKIQTLHAFCLKLLQQYSSNERTKRGVNLFTDEQRQLTLQAAYTKAIINNQANTQLALHLAEIFDSRALQEKILSLFNPTARLSRFLSKFTDEDSYLEIFKEYNADPEITASQLTNEKVRLLQEEDLRSIKLKNNEVLTNWLAADEKEKVQIFPELCNVFLTKEDEPRKCLQKDALAWKVANIMADYRQQWKSQKFAEYYVSLLKLSKAVLLEYTKSCISRGLFEHEDLIAQTAELLVNSSMAQWVLYQLDMKIDHVLVDEAQDISPQQWQIILLLTDDFFAGLSARVENRTVFIVGDYKQSIYGFQGANPDYLAAIKDHYLEKVNSVGKIWREIQLVISFRSVSVVLDFVDAVFNKNNLKLNWQNDKLKHSAYRAGGGFIKINSLHEIEEKQGITTWHYPKPSVLSVDVRKQKVANMIGEHIEEWLTKGRMLHNAARVIRPADILILMRKRSDLQYIIIQELKRRSIAVMDADRFDLAKHMLVQDFIALFNFILLPEDDMNLGILLKSPIVGLTELNLYDIAHARQGTLWQSLMEKAKAKADYLQSLRELARLETISIYQLVTKVLYEDSKLKEFILEMGNFAEEVANDFLQAVLNYEQENISDLQQFATWLETASLMQKSTQVEADSAVRVMTIHTAKGLQAPIVIIADAASSEQSPNVNFYWFGDQLYFGLQKELTTTKILAAKEKNKQLIDEENKRLLYVALTRAEDELHIYGWPNNRDKDSWYSALLATANMIEINNYEEEYTYKHEPILASKYEIILPEHLQSKGGRDAHSFKELVKPSQKQQMADNNPQNFLRGQLIHQLLFILPTITKPEWQKYSANFLKPYSKHIKTDDVFLVASQVIDKFPELFYGDDVFSEVAISAEINGKKINAQIDKLIINKDVIKLIDFKTDANIPSLRNEINPDYFRQMQLYRQIIAINYPHKQILTQILWTENQELSAV
jgi:ATP-dependent helicase/nuclease subunit A